MDIKLYIKRCLLDLTGHLYFSRTPFHPGAEWYGSDCGAGCGGVGADCRTKPRQAVCQWGEPLCKIPALDYFLHFITTGVSHLSGATPEFGSLRFYVNRNITRRKTSAERGAVDLNHRLDLNVRPYPGRTRGWAGGDFAWCFCVVRQVWVPHLVWRDGGEFGVKGGVCV